MALKRGAWLVGDELELDPVLSVLLGTPLALGLGPKEEVLLALTVVVGVITLGTGRTTVLQGIVHLAIFAAFLFLAVVP